MADNRRSIQRPQRRRKNAPAQDIGNDPIMKVIPLGGLGEIGKNLTAFETDDDMILVDCGLMFPDSDMFGIDAVIPDFSYLIEHQQKIRGLFITHGHEDHIGGIPYLLKQLNVPVYGTKLSVGLLENKLTEHGLAKKAKLNIVRRGAVIKVKGFTVEYIINNHSIPDSAGLYIKSKEGHTVFHTGDFKIDYTPVDGQQIDLQRIAQIGSEGIDLLIADSTNATKPGFTASETSVGQSFVQLFKGVKKRIIVATFASNIHRVQQVFDTARLYRRKVAISGRSMQNVVTVGKELKYLKFNDNILIDLNDINQYPDEQIVLLTTGSQGEPMAALSRMAAQEHRQVRITENDYVIISATPIPGNEKTVANVINDLFKLGAEVVYQGAADIHVSGHACQEELKLIQALVKPKYFMPAHGDYRMLTCHANLAIEMGMPKKNAFVLEIGDVLEIGKKEARKKGTVASGITLVDGLGIGDVGNIVLKDRKRLSEDGLFIIVCTMNKDGLISGPDVVSRGFVYMRESEELLAEAKSISKQAILAHTGNVYDYNAIKTDIKNGVEKYLFSKTKRRPMILPILMYVR